MTRARPKTGQSLGEKRPDLIDEWHTNNHFSPFDYTYGSAVKVWWQCTKCEHEWFNSPNQRTTGGTRRDGSKGPTRGCPACAGRLHSDGRNSLANLNPILASEFHPTKNAPLTPHDLVAGTNKKLWWLCNECQHEWVTISNSRYHNDSGCGVCTGAALHSDGRNSMANTHPDLVSEFDTDKNAPLTPHDLVAGTNKKLWWICSDCQNEWQAQGNTRTRTHPSGCPYCSENTRKLHSDGRNSMANTHPKLAQEFDLSKNTPLTPDTIIAGVRRKLWWICSECEYEWKTNGYHRAGNNRGCPVCAPYSEIVHPDGHNSLATTHPNLASEFHPTKNGQLTTSNLRAGSGRKIWWVCSECEYEWKQGPGIRSGQGIGCPACCNTGFKPEVPACYYCFALLGPDGIWWYKGGISDDPERRKEEIQKSLIANKLPLDVEIIETQWFDEGWLARELETTLLREDSIRAKTSENFSGKAELFSLNPIQWARENGLLVVKQLDSA